MNLIIKGNCGTGKKFEPKLKIKIPSQILRREGGTGIEYEELRPGLDIEFWWPYDEKNKQISTKDKKVGRFRKCKVISAKAISDERPTKLEKENSQK